MESYVQASLRDQLVDRRQRLSAAVETLTHTAHLVDLLKQVDAALQRMDRGDFGLCEQCHESIETDRLLANPLLRFCIEHLDQSERDALQQDLELASQIQTALLPRREFRSGGWEVCYDYQPAGAVSGDYCEVLAPGDGSDRLFFAVGDVSGKGIAASLLMAHLHAIFRSLVSADLSLKETVERANRIFCGSATPSCFATLVCGRAGQSGEVEICNAGHCPPLVFPDGRGAGVEATGLPLGLFAFAEYSTRKLRLRPDQGLLLYTDGLTEATDGAEEEFGLDRLVGFVESHSHFSGPEMILACRRALVSFAGGAPARDDVTIMVVRRAIASNT
jgi:sigma-B regulation protein RsbU (phosphoserine phosphatase)